MKQGVLSLEPVERQELDHLLVEQKLMLLEAADFLQILIFRVLLDGRERIKCYQFH